jgi:hypothetical protein
MRESRSGNVQVTLQFTDGHSFGAGLYQQTENPESGRVSELLKASRKFFQFHGQIIHLYYS